MPDPLLPAALEPLRKQTVLVLCEHFAADHLSDAELERRLDRANAAATVAELRQVIADLPALAAPPGAGTGLAATSVPSPLAAAPGTVPDRQVVAAFMGGVKRKGSWTPPRELQVFAVLGGADLDFREARFGPGVTEVTVFALMGGVEITVPPGLHVEVSGIAVLGGFDHRGQGAPPTDPSAPVLRITGMAIMGGVDIKVRLPGEGGWQAFHRARKEIREIRRLARGDRD